MLDVALIRKVAAADLGRRALDELTSSASPDNSLGEVLQTKVASAVDPELFKVAASMPGDADENYVAFGGKYKTGAWITPQDLRSLKQVVKDNPGKAAAGGAAALAAGEGTRRALKKEAFGQPMFQVSAAPDPSQTMGAPGAAAGAPKPAAAAAPAPAAPAAGGMSGGPMGAAGPSMGGMKAPGAGGGNPMAGPSIPKIPGAGGENNS